MRTLRRVLRVTGAQAWPRLAEGICGGSRTASSDSICRLAPASFAPLSLSLSLLHCCSSLLTGWVPWPSLGLVGSEWSPSLWCESRYGGHSGKGGPVSRERAGGLVVGKESLRLNFGCFPLSQDSPENRACVAEGGTEFRPQAAPIGCQHEGTET